jgi:TolB-like protein
MHHRLWHLMREYLTHWTVAGAILAATGAAPEHWFAELMHSLHLPHDSMPTWVEGVDLRLVAVIVGLSIIVGDTLWRHHRVRSEISAAGSHASHETVPQAIENMAGLDEGSPSQNPHGELLLPHRPSVAVLPFTNMSGDSEQEYFADGVAEDVITALSRMGWLFVIARNSSFSYKGKSPDIRDVGRDLGVRYVLEGSIRKAGGKVRIACQLIEAATRGHVWADRFEGDLQDIFGLQDRISESVAGAIEPICNARRSPASLPRRPGVWMPMTSILGHWHIFIPLTAMTPRSHPTYCIGRLRWMMLTHARKCFLGGST